jgi:hypothetical protein
MIRRTDTDLDISMYVFQSHLWFVESYYIHLSYIQKLSRHTQVVK